MCPPSYRHNVFMATPELGHRMYGYTLWERTALWSHQSVQTVGSERYIVQIVIFLKETLHPIQESAQTAWAVSEIY